MLRLVSRATARVGAAKVVRASAFAARSVHVEASTPSIQTAIEENDVMLFTKTTCPFCARVKDLFDTLDIPYTAAELNELDNGAEIQDLLVKMTGQRTVPNVFIKGQHIGGCDETLSLHDQKKLLPLFEKN